MSQATCHPREGHPVPGTTHTLPRAAAQHHEASPTSPSDGREWGVWGAERPQGYTAHRRSKEGSDPSDPEAWCGSGERLRLSGSGALTQRVQGAAVGSGCDSGPKSVP